MEKNVGIISYEIPAWENLPPLPESPSESPVDDSLEMQSNSYKRKPIYLYSFSSMISDNLSNYCYYWR
jgi:hypothetical protein